VFLCCNKYYVCTLICWIQVIGKSGGIPTPDEPLNLLSSPQATFQVHYMVRKKLAQEDYTKAIGMNVADVFAALPKTVQGHLKGRDQFHRDFHKPFHNSMMQYSREWVELPVVEAIQFMHLASLLDAADCIPGGHLERYRVFQLPAGSENP
jgi:hypothetical protein